jgi:hypothetical protein
MRDMFDAFQPWVLATYGDSAKTKTITARKYARILRTLQGQEANSADNSKFRFWVKAKGFRVGPPPGQQPPLEPRFRPLCRMTVLAEPELYVPTGTDKVSRLLLTLALRSEQVVRYCFLADCAHSQVARVCALPTDDTACTRF